MKQVNGKITEYLTNAGWEVAEGCKSFATSVYAATKAQVEALNCTELQSYAGLQQDIGLELFLSIQTISISAKESLENYVLEDEVLWNDEIAS